MGVRMQMRWLGSVPARAWVLLLGLVSIGAPSSVRGEIPDLVWQPAQVVDQPVTEMSSTSGASMVFAGGKWHIVYTRTGGVALYRSHDENGWSEFVPVGDDTAAARDPKIAALPPSLLVAWDDSRTGHPEIWTRRNDGTGWLAEECITCDDRPSRAPVVAAHESLVLGGSYFVAWEEDSLGVEQIRGRFFSGGVWGPTQMVSEGPAAAVEPAVAELKEFGVVVAWTDMRSGMPQIHLRMWWAFRGWEPEVVVSDQPYACRRPAVHSESCCGDLVFPHWMVAYEVELPGATECHLAGVFGNGEWISPLDDLRSVTPDMAGFTFIGPWPITFSASYFAAWTDEPPAGGHRHMLIDLWSRQTEVLSETGLSHALLAASGGIPRASVLAMWLEERAGVPSLIARRGGMPGYLGVPEAVPTPGLTAVPNPCRERVRLRLDGVASGDTDIMIIDATGRRVRTLGHGDGAPSVAKVWDLRDDRGRRVGPGHYFAIAEPAGRRVWRAIVVLE